MSRHQRHSSSAASRSPWRMLLLLLVIIFLTKATSQESDDSYIDSDAQEIAVGSLREQQVPSTFVAADVDASDSTLSATDITKPESSVETRKTPNGKQLLKRALQKAVLNGGLPGAVAGAFQVFSLMWVRTVLTYQYRYGSTFLQGITQLYKAGGIPRLYSGISFALIQVPLAKFVSTAANDGVSILIQSLSWTRHWGPEREVVVAALVVGFFRIMLMPIDTCKTIMQIESRRGLAKLMAQVRRGNVLVLYSGALANAVSSFVGHYPWFYIYNLLSRSDWLKVLMPSKTRRNALIGFLSSVVSDTVANFIRVIKVTKQGLATSSHEDRERSGGDAGGGKYDGSEKAVTYAEAVNLILAVDGWRGLFGRGLKTRIFANGIQSIVFTVLWRGLAEQWTGKREAANAIDSNKIDARVASEVDTKDDAEEEL